MPGHIRIVEEHQVTGWSSLGVMCWTALHWSDATRGKLTAIAPYTSWTRHEQSTPDLEQPPNRYGTPSHCWAIWTMPWTGFKAGREVADGGRVVSFAETQAARAAAVAVQGLRSIGAVAAGAQRSGDGRQRVGRVIWVAGAEGRPGRNVELAVPEGAGARVEQILTEVAFDAGDGGQVLGADSAGGALGGRNHQRPLIRRYSTPTAAGGRSSWT